MEYMLFGEGWLSELLSSRGVPGEIKDAVRDRLAAREAEAHVDLEAEWKAVDELLGRGEVGEALLRAMESATSSLEDLREVLGDKSSALERPFSPFLVKSREIGKILHPKEEIAALARSADDLDIITGLEMINDARRLLASWGAEVWGRKPLKLIPRLEEDLEELRRMQAELPGGDDLEEEDFEKEIELADRFATMATRFAQDLWELNALNAANPEVRMRFRLLWDNVSQLADDGDLQAAALEAMQVLEEAFELAGMGGGETLEKVDMLYDSFSEVDDLRRAVDLLSRLSREGEEDCGERAGRTHVEAVRRALCDMGLVTE